MTLNRMSRDLTEMNKLEDYLKANGFVYKREDKDVGLNQATTMYVVEDINGADVNKYKYEINYLPEMIQPFDIVQKE